jgi:membrane protein DedA with SNARE-associated domain
MVSGKSCISPCNDDPPWFCDDRRREESGASVRGRFTALPAAPGRRKPSRRTLTLLVTPIVALVAASAVGNAIWPALLKSHPLLLIALDARNRYLVLVATKLDVVPFVVVGVLRRLASDPLFFILGWLYGDRAVRWVERRFAPDTGLTGWMETRFSKLAPVLVFLFPGPLVCVLAGAAGMSPLWFAVCNVAGTITIVAVLYAFGDVFHGPVSAVTGFVDRNFKVFTAVSILVTVLWLLDQRRRGKGEVTSVAEAERELEAEAEVEPE